MKRISDFATFCYSTSFYNPRQFVAAQGGCFVFCLGDVTLLWDVLFLNVLFFFTGRMQPAELVTLLHQCHHISIHRWASQGHLMLILLQFEVLQ